MTKFLDYFYIFLYSLVLVSSLIYIWHDLQNKKINFKNKKIYITLILLMIISIFNYYFVDKSIKIVLIAIVLMLFFHYLFRESIQKSIVTAIFYEFIIMISETLYAIILIPFIGNDATVVINSCFGTLITNIVISIISIVIAKIPIVKKLYTKLVNYMSKIKINRLLIFSIFILILGNVLAVATYYKFNFKYVIVINSIITISCSVIVIYLFRVQENLNKVSNKYNIAINSLKEYENMMSKYRISNHENKNLLLTIRAMLVNNEEGIPDYINSMIKEKYEDDDKLLFETSSIPVGGLKATIYSEILKIKRENINYKLTIDKKVKTESIIDLDDDTILDICKIIGVLIDNAIDEVKRLKKKNITISIYTDKNNLIIKISNNYKTKIDTEKVFDEGYTTKGKNHGYGLSLVKKIIDNNEKINNSLEISKTIFSQIICIKK